MGMKVWLESPEAGSAEERIKYQRYHTECMRDSLKRGEYPISERLLYKSVINYNFIDEIVGAKVAVMEWGMFADKVVLYQDFGVTGEMKNALTMAEDYGIEVEYRNLSKFR